MRRFNLYYVFEYDKKHTLSVRKRKMKKWRENSGKLKKINKNML